MHFLLDFGTLCTWLDNDSKFVRKVLRFDPIFVTSEKRYTRVIIDIIVEYNITRYFCELTLVMLRSEKKILQQHASCMNIYFFPIRIFSMYGKTVLRIPLFAAR